MTGRRLIDYVFLAVLVGAVTFAINYFVAGKNTGQVFVIDGDSLRIDGRDIRLMGIDAPELDQTCRLKSGRPYACGRKARRFLRKLVAGKVLKCKNIDIDRYGRDLAICRAGETEINRAMIEAGWAVAFLDFSFAYARSEARARKARKGIWAGDFDEPQDWRRD